MMAESRLRGQNKAALVAFLAALVASSVLLVVTPAGVDAAAHFHLQSIYSRHGFAIWDNTWYLGRYSFVNYSYLLYFLAYFVGLKTVAALSTSVIVAMGSLLADQYFPGALRSWRRMSLGVVPLMIVTGAWPFLLGGALLGVALEMRRRRMRLLFLLCAILVLLSSPLALLGLILIVFAVEVPVTTMISSGTWREGLSLVLKNFYIYTVALLGMIQFLSMRAFPDHGYYPYWWIDLFIVEIFVGLCFVLVSQSCPHRFKLRLLIAGYGALNLVAFVIKSNLGSNAARVGDIALPVLSVLVAERRNLSRIPVITILGLGLVWNLMPTTQILSPSLYHTSNQAFWSRLQPSLTRYWRPGSRIELVDTSNHQGDYYLAKMGFPLVRGWFRQDDFPQNSILYASRLSASAYLKWLRASGASLVLLPPGPYDFSANAEAALLQSGRSGLIALRRIGSSELYGVPGSPTIISGPGSTYINSKIGISTIAFNAPMAGTYKLSVFYSPYLQPSQGTICRNTKGFITWNTNSPGSRRLVLNVTVSKVVSVLLGDSGRSCG